MTVAPDPATATAAYYAPRPCSALADKTVYGGRYRAYATRKDCMIFEVNNFQTQAHYDWLPDVFHKEQPRQGDLFLFRWTGFHSVVQVHDVLQEKLIPGGITSGPKKECLGGPKYSCANAPPTAGEYLIDTEDYRPGVLHFPDEDAIHNPTLKECWNSICSAMNQEFLLEYRKPEEQLRCCDLPGASGKYSTKCRVVEIYNDAAGAQWNPDLIGAGGNDVVRFRWAGTIRAEARRAWPAQARAIRCGGPALRDRASATSEPAMPSATSLSKALMTAVIAVAIGACSDEHSTPAAPSASAAPPPPPPPVSAAAAPTPTPTPMPTPSATASGPVHACPAGSSGDGSLSKPCDAKGTARMMEVTWTGKMADGGPQFRVINKSPSVILYGKFVAYFYDKAGKQLDVKDAAGQAHPNQACVGNLFSGIMKPAEKAVITFSCVKKEHVPEGTVAVEGEMQMVGFADASEKKSEYYWRNNDLTPDKRPKGGAK